MGPGNLIRMHGPPSSSRHGGVNLLVFLLLLFVGLPLIELALLFRVARLITPLWTLGLVVFTGVLGATLARRQGVKTWRRVQSDLAEGRMPASHLVDALLIFVAGVVLVTPGIITDAIGFALLIPPIRAALKREVADFLRSRMVITHVETTQRGTTQRDEFVDVEPISTRDGDASDSHP